ncbi:PREDICTED: B-box zinc finger protein 21-like isoform X2 [Nelumbo nucifera]|uniref:B-box zinc finger protein 21-like isoform X2 n=1 Tax=Nelumbo nucifera TaxID=4432 RepID=A0A1U8B5P5_NELNU|nr:PREDICTED: B-box zinc finger protein 21-like isoform X2 [Nelumbo nucifera]
MKIQCDVCDKDEASVFCSADEAALCDGCDRRVHHANKLAGKHLRFSLLHPSFKEAPRCDVCQERRAFLFCQEDRAILCRECDHPIHTANDHTKKHNRFLLTGVKLSSSSSLYSATNSSTNEACDSLNGKVNENKISKLSKKQKPMPVPFGEIVHPKPPMVEKPPAAATITTSKADDHPASEGYSTSSITEYLMETLPGWQVEDFLDSYSAPHGFW